MDAVQQGLVGAWEIRDIKTKSVRGGAVTLAGQVLSILLQFGSTFLLARLLTPEDYGIQGMVYTLIAFLNIFKDAGLSVASIQRQTLTHDQISTLYWLNIATGAGLAGLLAASAPLLADFYHEPRVVWVAVLSSLVFLLHGASIQHRALLNRAMRFTAITGIDVGSAIFGVVVGILMAVGGYRYWSLVWMNISGSIVSTAAYYVVMPWRPGRPVRGSGVGSMIRYGSTVTLNSVVVYFAYNTEKILLGRFWGAAPLGIYGRAYSLANLPVQQFIASVGSVAFPLLSRVQSDAERLRRAFLRCHALVVSMIIPALTVCAVFAEEIISVLLGPKWAGVAPVVRWLMPTVLAFALINPLSWLLRSIGLVQRSLNIALMIAPVVILGILAGLKYGPIGVAIGYSGAMVLLSAPMVAWAKHGTGISTRDFLGAIKDPMIAGACGAVAAGIVKWTAQALLSPATILIAGAVISCGTYAMVLLFVLKQKVFYADLVQELVPKSRRFLSRAGGR